MTPKIHKPKPIYLILIILLLSTIACKRQVSDPVLISSRLLLDNPDSVEYVLSKLDTIEEGRLSEYERHILFLRKVKAHDKLDIIIPADSGIVATVHFLSQQRKCIEYVEALYYAGRISEHNGHMTRALQYYKNSLDEYNISVKDINPVNLNLKANILSNIGGILNFTRNYRMGRPFILETIKIDSILNDSVGLILDYKVLGTDYLNTNQLDSAFHYLKLAEDIAIKSAPKYLPLVRMYIADIFNKQGESEKALNTIRGIPELTFPSALNTALSIAADIYGAANISDTAYMYAKQLAFSENPLNRKNGLNIIANNISHNNSNDSIHEAVSAFHKALNSQSEKPAIDPVIANEILYGQPNDSHQISSLPIIIIVVSIFIIITILLIVFGKVWVNDRLENLLTHTIFKNLKIRKDNKTSYNKNQSSKKIIQELKRNKFVGKYQPDKSIRESKEYMKITQLLTDKKKIPTDVEFWDGLQKVVSSAAPSFIPQLDALTDNSISIEDLRLAILIKIGLSSADIGRLLQKEKGTMSYRRKKWCERIFKGEITPSDMDAVIHAM